MVEAVSNDGSLLAWKMKEAGSQDKECRGSSSWKWQATRLLPDPPERHVSGPNYLGS